MAVPAFRAKTMFAEAAGTTMKFTVPAGTSSGDTLIVAIELGKKKTVAAPSGEWKEPATQVIPAIEEWTVAIFYLPNWSEAKHGKEFTFTWDGVSISRHGFISSWSGCDTSSPVSAVSNAAIKECTPESTVATIDGYTTPTDENLLLQFLFNNEGRLATPPTGYTEFADQAAGPAGNYKNEGVAKGAQAKVEITVSKQVTMTLGLSLQPPQTAGSGPHRGSLALLGVGR